MNIKMEVLVYRKSSRRLVGNAREAGGRRCYGIVGDALYAVIDVLRRNGTIEFVHVRHEVFNGLMRKEGAPVIAIAGDVESSLFDTSTLEELNAYKFFDTASLYTASLVNPDAARSVINTAILTAVLEKGPKRNLHSR